MYKEIMNDDGSFKKRIKVTDRENDKKEEKKVRQPKTK